MSSVALEYAGDPGGVEIPDFPAGYRLRPYQPGDRESWVRIHRRTGIYERIDDALFWREFGRDDHPALPLRQFFIDYSLENGRGGASVATGTLWFPHEDFPQSWGRVHWIAVDPAHQRRGLASNLVRYLLHLSPLFGCERVYLTTGSDNYPAISLYRRLGFIPYARTEAERLIWAAME